MKRVLVVSQRNLTEKVIFYRLKGGECDIHGDFWNFQGGWISEHRHPEVGTCIMCLRISKETWVADLSNAIKRQSQKIENETDHAVPGMS